MKMPSAFRFRLYPNSEQEERMLRTMEACRRLWNDALAHRKRRWGKLRRSTSYNHQAWVLTAERHADPALAEVYSQAAQDVLRRLDRAFEAFFDGRSRHPRFKKLSSAGSFAYPQAYNGSVKPDVLRKRLFLSKVGNVKAVFHRPLPRDSRVKTCMVTREPDGEWYASLVYDEVVPLQDVRTPAMQQQPVGVDLGLLSLIATSDGEKVEHPKLLRNAEKRLKRLQRSLSRKRKGSNNRSRARHRLASQHARVRRQRADFNHKLSALLVKSHSLVAFEDLKVRNMVRNRALAKSIHDAGWSQLVRFAEYKASRAGKLVVRVPAAYSTQECSFCGALNKVPLSVRRSECASCGRTLDRDFAARIMLKRGLAQVGQGMPELKPAEAGPLPVPTTVRASQAEEAGTIRGVDRATRQEARRWKPTSSLVGGCHGKTLGGKGLW